MISQPTFPKIKACTESKLKVRDRVAVRNYISTENWKFGSVINVLNKLHHLLKLDEQRIWKRLENQTRAIGKNIEANDLSHQTLFGYESAES